MCSLQNNVAELKVTYIDLKSRSMRDNLLFHGKSEIVSEEDSIDIFYDLCENKLNIQNAMEIIKIDVAHRFGTKVDGKPRW